jgi:hypothetical protein
LIPRQDDGQDGAAIELGAGEQTQFGEDRFAHLLGFVDQQHGAIEGGVDMGEPFFAQNFGTVPAAVRGQGHAEEMAQFAVKIGQIGLGPCQQADTEIAHTA